MSYFEENNKFLSFKGVIGRRNFIILYLVVMLITCVIYQTPLMYAILINPKILQTLSSGIYPLWLSALMLIAGIFTGLLFLPAVIRRIRDILGEENDNKIYLFSIICLAIGIISLTPVGRKFGVGLIDFVIDAILICTKGKITGEKPKNNIIQFNWGAFLGTCFWGLWNKIYKTLWIIPLLFTCGGSFIFMLICGLKGNEWVFDKNKNKYDSIEKFHSQQANQSIIFTVLTPIFIVVCFILSCFILGTVVSNYAKTHPEFVSSVDKGLIKYQLKATEANFDKIEITNDDYKFYIQPQNWKTLSESGKTIFYENALNYALIKNDKYLKTTQQDYIDIAQKVRIISTFNNEILAEFICSDTEETKMIEYSKNKDYKNLWAIRKKCIKINSKPSTP